MKVAALAALSVLIALPAEAGQRHRQHGSPATTCDNNGHVTLGASAPITSYRNSRSETQRTIATAPASVRARSRPTATRQLVSSYRSRRARRPVLAFLMPHGFRPTSMIWKPITARACYLWAAFGPGRFSSSSEHPCGKALDVCQRRRGVVDPRCNLPGRVALGQIAASHGLFEGGRWCDSDYGHAQIGVTAAARDDHRVRIVQQ